METKAVYLYHWELGLYPGYECYGYSEYGKDGIPLFAEIRKIRKDTWKEYQQKIHNQYLREGNYYSQKDLSDWDWQIVEELGEYFSIFYTLKEMNS